AALNYYELVGFYSPSTNSVAYPGSKHNVSRLANANLDRPRDRDPFLPAGLERNRSPVQDTWYSSPFLWPTCSEKMPGSSTSIPNTGRHWGWYIRGEIRAYLLTQELLDILTKWTDNVGVIRSTDAQYSQITGGTRKEADADVTFTGSGNF